ncbi:MAG: alcohol dehydrogenase catalytic domain-containing protein [Streptosporangiales bacterium]|nr:alcohol dehydrogenase catalytic domain-containing protein [Streptosporangiales bacterium]
MRAIVYEAFDGPLEVRDVPAPTPTPDGAVVRVEASGLCRSDWHGWRGHDPDVEVPHVPGHEFAGVVETVGPYVRGWSPGARVTTPFVCGCGRCAACQRGQHQVCVAQTQPGFTHWGSFAEYVLVEHADVNLVALPDELSAVTAASLGCRYATAWRAVVQQGDVAPGEWVAVYGCGGVGLSAVQIAVAAGARVVAVDVSADALALARELGADVGVDAAAVDSAADAVREHTGGGAHLSLDALGSAQTCASSIESLRTQGRHVQVGLLPRVAGAPTVPMDVVIARELVVLGSHGLAAHAYPQRLAAVTAGRLRPDLLVRRTVTLAEACTALPALGDAPAAGVTVVDSF